MGEFTIVTDFFDIGRGQDKNQNLSRTKERYFQEFAYWARIRNRMVVYTDSSGAEQIRKIRADFGLEDRTSIVIIDNLFEIEGDMLARMQAVSKRKEFLQFRYYPEAFSNNPQYDYLWMMKYWFMNDAHERGLLGDTVAWVDFGFDHGGRVYSNPEDFDFLWSYDISDKINLYCLSDPDKMTGMESLQLLDDCVMASMTTLPEHLVPELWKLVRNAMEALLMLDCIDDDQQLLLMSYKARPDLFDVHISDWFLPMKEYGGSHLRLKARESQKPEEKKGAVDSLKKKIKPLLWWRKDPKRDFARRCYERAEKILWLRGRAWRRN